MGTAVSGTHIAGDFKGLNGSASKLQLRNSDTHSEFVGKCRLHRGGRNIDYRSIPEFPPRVYKLENFEKPYLLIRFLWFIFKVSSFF